MLSRNAVQLAAHATESPQNQVRQRGLSPHPFDTRAGGRRALGVIPTLTLAVALAFVVGTALHVTAPRASESAGDSSETGDAADSGSSAGVGDASAAGKWKAAAPKGWFGRPSDLQAPPFVDRFEGFDLAALTPAQHELFIQRANTELCTCGHSGCLRHTLGFCLRVDPGCPRARKMLQGIYESLSDGTDTAGTGEPVTAEESAANATGASQEN